MTSVVFLHGLNTYGDDDLHIGPLSLGPMHAPWENALTSRGCEFLAVTGLGSGGPEEQAAIALEFLRARGWLEKQALHLVGHSTGGLAIRALACEPALAGRVKSVLTVGTPHEGTSTADFALKFEREYPRLQRLFSRCGYDTRVKNEIFLRFTPEAVARFNTRCFLPNEVRGGHALCEIPREKVSWPLLFFYDRLHSMEERGRSDGFIHSRSQSWGERLGPYRLDHFGNLGFFPHVRHALRREARLEFERLAEEALAWMKGPVSL